MMLLTWQRTRQVVREGGYALLLHRLLHLCAGPFLAFGRITFFKRDLAESLQFPGVDGRLVRRFATPADIDGLCAQRARTRSAEFFRERFRRGDTCVVATTPDQRIAHSRWLTTRRAHIPELGLDLILEPGAAYFYDGYTTPADRKSGADGAMRCFIFDRMQAAGCRAVYSYVVNENPAGMRAARRWQQPVGTLWYFRVGHWRPFVAGLRRLDGLRLVRPVFAHLEETERAARASVSRAWFDAWLKQPLSQRSTGCDNRPFAYFQSTADYVAGALALDRERDAVLDLGCDSAMVSRLVAKRCQRLTGIDPVAGMLADVPRETFRSASGRPISLLAGDGRFLPFPDRTFDKAYCCAVIHVLPSRADGLAIINELIRVCRPGGRILMASVPDRGKRLVAWLDVFRHARPADRLKQLLALALPTSARRRLRSWLGLPAPNYPVAVDYSLRQLKRHLECQGLRCTVERFPADYWARDFRKVRSNLVIDIPPETEALAMEAGARTPAAMSSVA